ncbi:hypothetical protein OUZ56_007394 [Daphnia magna]|uniref:Uncharacterized protein n=1 Tax=Daphnia magna TaxID=35525 RepID=A0ABR0A9T6_9CRUS|nr:hypothetical protein OUZ56_007394 [Daphnia magna]
MVRISSSRWRSLTRNLDKSKLALPISKYTSCRPRIAGLLLSGNVAIRHKKTTYKSCLRDVKLLQEVHRRRVPKQQNWRKENHATTWISTIQIGFLHYHWIKLAAAPVLKEDFCSATIEFCIPRRLQTQHHPLKQIFLMRVTLMTMSLII